MKKTTPIIIILIAIASFLAGSFVTKSLSSNLKQAEKQAVVTPSPTAVQAQKAPVITLDTVKGLFKTGNISFGDANKKVLFVEISDPSCPFCQIAAGKNPTLNIQAGDRFKLVSSGGTYIAPVPEMKKLVDQGSAGYVWLYYPGHGNGELASKALYCAYEEGKFWQTHDLLMTAKGYDLINNQVKNDSTKVSLLVNFLKTTIDSNKLTSCLASGKYDSKLTEDMNVATTLGINGTPMFIVNTQAFNGAYSFTDMKSSVDSLLK
jgi:protein-disulfide isomerase